MNGISKNQKIAKDHVKDHAKEQGNPVRGDKSLWLCYNLQSELTVRLTGYTLKKDDKKAAIWLRNGISA